MQYTIVYVYVAVMGPDFPKPELKIVTADKIFDSPGRSERPSHVSIGVCVCVCVCVQGEKSRSMF